MVVAFNCWQTCSLLPQSSIATELLSSLSPTRGLASAANVVDVGVQPQIFARDLWVGSAEFKYTNFNPISVLGDNLTLMKTAVRFTVKVDWFIWRSFYLFYVVVVVAANELM